MASVTFPRSQFEREIGKLDEKMEERIAMLGTPIEKITKEEIQIEVFPNRPDLLSYHGFKRALLAFLGKKTGLQKYKVNKSKETYRVIADSSLKDIRPHTVCAVIKGLKLDSEKIKEIIEIQEKLHLTLGRKRKKLAIGIYPLEKIKFPVTFKAIEPDKIKFTPLDYEKDISGLEILQKHPTGKEYAHLLSGKARFPIFIDANNQILSMPPVINSQTTGRVTEKTRDIFVECSGFDFEILSKCLNILVSVLSDMGGDIYEVEVNDKSKKILPDLEPEVISINVANANKLLGLDLKENDIKKLLEKMGYNYNKNVAEIPPWRIDILHEVDIIEDIAIAYGYENFVPEIPAISTVGQQAPIEVLKKKVSEILTGLDIQEVSNYHLTTISDQFEKMDEDKESGFVELENSKTDYNILRKNLSHYLLKILAENVNNEFPQRIFEIGRIFGIKENITYEKDSLALAITPGNFTEAKQIIEYLFRMLNLNIKIEEPKENPAYFIKGRVAEIRLDNKAIGFIGEIHPKILRNWRIRTPVALSEIDFDDVMKNLMK